MGTPYMSELRIFSFDFPPKGWAFCNGQLLPINQNQALFALLGTMYGGNGQTNFALPNLQGRVPMHVQSSAGFNQGATAGEVAHTVTQSELPTHTHLVQGTDTAGDQVTATGNVFANAQINAYAPATSNLVALMPQTVSSVGGSQPHENMSPYLALNFCIALQGIFPTRN